MGSFRVNTGPIYLKPVSDVFKNLADTVARWGNRRVSITETRSRLMQNTRNILRPSKRNEASFSKQKSPSASAIPKSVKDFIQNTTSKDRLTTLQKKLYDPQSIFNNLTHAQKGVVNRLILDKKVALDGIDVNKATTQQTRKPLKSSITSSTYTKRIINLVNNAKTTDQLTNLQKRLVDPKSQLSRLPKAQRKSIDLLIIDKIIAIRDAQASRKRS